MSADLLSFIDLAERYREPGDEESFKAVLRKHFCYQTDMKPDTPVEDVREYLEHHGLIEQVDYILLEKTLRILFPARHSVHAVYFSFRYT